ncbi:uncharacterized protein EDB91DRAFT_1119893 [Suillus paluster]|uniref:uncharacterized protein n=1 Tax=Suillus paluster TaxID=48578 RepID=UPI001B87CB2F|nr:uncharacterized protein EDB91DRAFT_1119893 [Suillus paluster]KAG1745972.1 hypothetical protein EDB91DRAFT_1119893 [Suillus paluster]
MLFLWHLHAWSLLATQSVAMARQIAYIAECTHHVRLPYHGFRSASPCPSNSVFSSNPPSPPSLFFVKKTFAAVILFANLSQRLRPILRHAILQLQVQT